MTTAYDYVGTALVQANLAMQYLLEGDLAAVKDYLAGCRSDLQVLKDALDRLGGRDIIVNTKSSSSIQHQQQEDREWMHR